jgi:hypothetical protein
MNDESNNNDKKVFRSFALPLVTFEYLKLFQREYQSKHKVAINNNQALAVLLAEHKQLNEDNEEYDTNPIQRNN